MSENPLEKALTALEEARELHRNRGVIEWDWSGIDNEEWQKDDPMLDSEEFQAILKHLCDTERTPLFQSDEKILGGKPCFWKTRIPVQLIVDFLQQGWTAEEVLRNYPGQAEAVVDAAKAFGEHSPS